MKKYGWTSELYITVSEVKPGRWEAMFWDGQGDAPVGTAFGDTRDEAVAALRGDFPAAKSAWVESERGS